MTINGRKNGSGPSIVVSVLFVSCLFCSVILISVYFSHSILLQKQDWNYSVYNDPFKHQQNEERTIEHTNQMIEKYMNGPMVDTPPDLYPLVPNLPSVLVKENIERGFYGGEGDKAHLGGFTDLDTEGITPRLWEFMLEHIGIKSMLDVGCGKGVSTTWFLKQGVDAVCVEGSHDAVTQSVLPKLGIPRNVYDNDEYNYDKKEAQHRLGDGPKGRRIVEHDFSRGPWWPSDKSYDAVWAVEFLEHVGRNYMKNYITTFKKAAIVFATHSNWGGWHHVEVHDDAWWIARYTSYGLIYNAEYTKILREKATPGHVKRSLMVFINPHVMSKPEHEHLFAEYGCFNDYNKPNVPCGQHPREHSNIGISVLPDSYSPIKYDNDKHNEWLVMAKELLQLKRKKREEAARKAEKEMKKEI